MRTDRIFFAPVNLALMMKIENREKTPARYKIIHNLAPVYQYRDYYQNINTKVKYKTVGNCNAHDLYVDETKLISFTDVIKKLDELDQEETYIPKHISRRRVLQLIKEK